MKLLLVGSTGLVGSHVLSLALADPGITSVIAPTRRALAVHAKLSAPIMDFDHLPGDAPWWQADAVICTLGTTMRTAGSQAAFRRVDYEYPLTVARLARQHGTPVYVLNSSIGANAASRFFYTRVKGELERDLASLGFQSLTLVRPGFIDGQRLVTRPGERAMICALKCLRPVLPDRWRINPAQQIARALLQSARQPTSGIQVITSDLLQ